MNEQNATPDKSRWFKVLPVAFIFLTAVWLRLHLIETTGIWGDQSFTLNTAMRWVNGGEIPLAANKSSVGIMNPPMIEYLYAAALRLWPDILSVAWLTLATGVAALALAAWTTSQLFGWRAGLWALALFAVNPWAVFYSQLIWNQTLVPFFATLTLSSLLLYFALHPRGIYLVLAFVGAACMTQVHPGSMMQLGTIGLILLVFWRQVRPWPLLAGVLLFILLYVPFLMYQNGVGWMDVRATLAMAGEPGTFSPASLLLSLDLLHAKGLRPTAVLSNPLDTAMSLLFGFSLLYTMVWGGQQFRRRQRDEAAQKNGRAIVILLLWLIMPVLFYLRTAVYLQVYYVISQWPAPFILMGLAVASAQEWLERPQQRRWGRPVSFGLSAALLLILAGQTALNWQIQTARLDDGEVQIRHVRQAIRQVNALAGQRPECPLVLVSEGHQVEVSRLALLREFTQAENILLADGRLALPLPAPCALYLDALPGSAASQWLGETAVSLPDSAITIQDEVWRFYELPPEQHEQLIRPLAAGGELAAWLNGAALLHLAHGPARPGEPLSLTLFWAVNRQPDPQHYHTGVYLLADENQVVAQSDGPGFDSIQWRSGDHFLTWSQLPLPADLLPGTYRLALSQYVWPTLERIDLTAGDNTFFGPEIVIPGG
jgi:4-amino-4-deoxy-L-arabinose transferase-like glycosyltransferase